MDNSSINNFRIAGFDIRIIFANSKINNMRLIPSLKPFLINEVGNNLFFKLVVDDNLKAISEENCERIRDFDTGNGNTIVDKLKDGGYQYIINNIDGENCCILQTNKEFSDCRCSLNGNSNMRTFGLNSTLMMIFAFAGSKQDTVLIHASLVRNNGYGYAFIAKSGTGKSTQVSLWLKHIEGCDLMNDDNPIIRVIDNKCYIYGSPWSGKTPCYRNVKAKLGAITRIERAKENSIEKMSIVGAFASVLPSCSAMKWDNDIYNDICNTISKIIGTTDIYTLHCLPNKEAAELCYKTISK